MTTANKVTIARILLIPFFVVEILYYVKTGNETHRFAGLLTFALAAILDGLDGYIARHYNQTSQLGAILDPLADKLLLVSAVVLLSFDHRPHLGQFPFWLAGIIISRDILILIGMIVIQTTVGKVAARPHVIGKIATLLQIMSVIWVLLKWDAGYGENWMFFWTVTSAVLTGVSGIFYVMDGIRQLSASPRSSANSTEIRR
jgi:CDP-diacylglycerol--glycerol-3-phosphate 3-phosphatidyltransferase